MRPTTKKRTVPVLLAALSLAASGGCLFQDETAKRGSEIENELGVGRLVLADGTPAAGARVRIYTVDHLPRPDILAKKAAVAFEALTDGEGRYRIDSLARGEYNILGELDGEVSYADSVVFAGAKPRLPTDTLQEAGAVVGRVELQPNHDFRTATVQVLGTQVFANVDEEGVFRLERLAQGTYSIRVATTLAEYTPLYVSIRVRAGARDTLEGSLAPVYTGIPVVTGLGADFDTMAQAVTLRWRPVAYRHLQEYLVYRSAAGSLSTTGILMARTRDTAFTDVLEAPAGGTADTTGYEYRVRVRNQSDQVGLAFGYLTVRPVPRSLVTSGISLSFVSGNDHAGVGDSVAVLARYGNPTRLIRKVEWLVSGSDSVLAMRTDSSLQGSHEFTWSWDAPGKYKVRVRVTDEGGDRSEAGLDITVNLDAPEASAGADALIEKGGTLRIKGEATDRYGRIVKMEWDIGGTGAFVETSTGDTVIRLPDSAAGTLPCVFRATDNRGLVGLDTLWVRILNGRILRSPHRPVMGKVLGGKIYMVTDGGTVFHYDLAGDRFETDAPIPGKPQHLDVVNGNLYAFIKRPPGFPFDPATVERLEPGAGWTRAGNHDIGWPAYTIAMPAGGSLWYINLWMGFANSGLFRWGEGDSRERLQGFTGISLAEPTGAPYSPFWAGRIIENRFYFAYGRKGGSATSSQVIAYNMPARIWETVPDRGVAGPIQAEFTAGRKWYLLAEDGRLEAYDHDSRTWSFLESAPHFDFPYTEQRPQPPRFAVVGTNAYLFLRDAESLKVWRYDIGSDAWTRLPDIDSEEERFEAYTTGDRIFLSSGRQFIEYIPD